MSGFPVISKTKTTKGFLSPSAAQIGGGLGQLLSVHHLFTNTGQGRIATGGSGATTGPTAAGKRQLRAAGESAAGAVPVRATGRDQIGDPRDETRQTATWKAKERREGNEKRRKIKVWKNIGR